MHPGVGQSISPACLPTPQPDRQHPVADHCCIDLLKPYTHTPPPHPTPQGGLTSLSPHTPRWQIAACYPRTASPGRFAPLLLPPPPALPGCRSTGTLLAAVPAGSGDQRSKCSGAGTADHPQGHCTAEQELHNRLQSEMPQAWKEGALLLAGAQQAAGASHALNLGRFRRCSGESQATEMVPSFMRPSSRPSCSYSPLTWWTGISYRAWL